MNQSERDHQKLVAQKSPNGDTAIFAQREIHSGPLPHPETLSQYGRIDPTLPMRIVAMAENEAAHRREIEKKFFDSDAQDDKAQRAETKRIQWLGTALCILILGVTVYALHCGAFIVAGILGGATLCFALAAYITKKQEGLTPAQLAEFAKFVRNMPNVGDVSQSNQKSAKPPNNQKRKK